MRAQVERSHDFGKDVRDGYRAEHLIARNKGKRPIISNDGDAPADDKLCSGRSLSMSPPPGRNAQGSTRAKSQKKHSHRPTLNDTISGASHAKEQVHRRQNKQLQAPRNASVLPDGTMPPMHPTFDAGPTFYTQSATLIWGPNDMLSSPLRQHILNYELPRGLSS